MIWLGITLLIVALGVGWVMQLLGLPGTWLIVIAAALFAWIAGPDSTGAISWQTVGVLTVLAILGEVVEAAAAAMGVTKAGGSRRGAVFALVGSMFGGLLGAFMGLPIPVVGPLVAAVLFAGLGALAGAVWGELSLGRNMDVSLKIGRAAFVGRVLGTLAKVIVASAMVVVTLVALAV